MRCRRRRGAGGFTLAEMLVVWLLVLLALALAADVLIHSQRLLRAAETQARHGAVWPLDRQLRHDLQGALRPEGAEELWHSGPLTLRGHPAGTVAYQLRGTDLVRTVRDAGTLRLEQRLAAGVTLWRWRRPAPGLVDVELVHGAAAAIRLELRVAPRGAGRAGAW